ncbi:MAG TPA: CheR family methyltransferase [Marinospirillum sp.]|uniref:CheR family methyltransferase n=1 Tax=Marinospirillum sp. TaxID=2183934 RepID=UPI002B46196F|nr:CheR family methyltransferase [Marinospirillum sp.]HKM15687.1 CheR family methyltransferase [Marinospirillum sp.]
MINQLTVNETYFFREPEQIQLVVDYLVPQIQAIKSPTTPLRILSAGCSSGEEPYSLAIALREALGEAAAKLIRIDAGDLDYNILKKAQQGLYSAFSFRGVDPALRKRYFKLQNYRYQLISDIRQQVTFHHLNLLAPVLPQHLSDYDIIFFRNVSIYFDLETRRLIQNKFYNLMNTNAILLLGSSETLGNDLGVFELVEQQNQYYFVKGQVYRSSELSKVVKSPSEFIETVATTAPAAVNFTALPVPIASSTCLPLVDIKTIQQWVIDGQQARALYQLDQLLAAGQEQQAARLLKSWLVLNNQNFEQAKFLLNQAFAVDAWSIDVMLMNGLSCKWQQQMDEAIQWFKKAVYTYPECWSAHYYLADIYRQEQQPQAAIRSYQTVLRILTANPDVGDGTQWIPLPLPAAPVIFLSQRHLQVLASH